METTAAPNNPTTSDRIDQFREDVAEMNLKAGNAGLERGLMILGVVLMVVGILGAFLSYVTSRNYGNQLDVGSAIAQTVAWVTLVITGAVFFLRYSLGSMLRMWLLRQLYEDRANTDRVLEALKSKG